MRTTITAETSVAAEVAVLHLMHMHRRRGGHHCPIMFLMHMHVRHVWVCVSDGVLCGLFEQRLDQHTPGSGHSHADGVPRQSGHTHTHTQREGEKQRKKETETETGDRDRDRDRDRGRGRDKETERQREKRYIYAHKERERVCWVRVRVRVHVRMCMRMVIRVIRVTAIPD